MSDLSAKCAPKRTFADHSELMGSRPGLETIVADEADVHQPFGLTANQVDVRARCEWWADGHVVTLVGARTSSGASVTLALMEFAMKQ